RALDEDPGAFPRRMGAGRAGRHGRGAEVRCQGAGVRLRARCRGEAAPGTGAGPAPRRAVARSGLSPPPAAASPTFRLSIPARGRLMEQPVTADNFSPLVGTAFTVVGRGERLTLIAVEKGRAPPRAQRQPFILFFQGPSDRLLAEGAYEFETEGGT